MKSASITRRRFLETASALGVGVMGLPTLIPRSALGASGRPGANNQFVIGLIGTGGMGGTHLVNLLRFQKEGKVRLAAVCDCDDNRLEAAWENTEKKAKPYRDYRYILERSDINCVLIATPDHWHAVQTVHACQTGKHVYVEKPASVTVRDGQAMVAAARANKVAVQVGAQARTAKERGTPAGRYAMGSWARSARLPVGITPVPRMTSRCRTRSRRRGWTGICGWGRCRGNLTTNAISPATFVG